MQPVTVRSLFQTIFLFILCSIIFSLSHGNLLSLNLINSEKPYIEWEIHEEQQIDPVATKSADGFPPAELQVYPWRSGFRKPAIIILNSTIPHPANLNLAPAIGLKDKENCFSLCRNLGFTDIYVSEEATHQEIINLVSNVIRQEECYKEHTLQTADAAMIIAASMGVTVHKKQWLAARDQWYPLSDLENLLSSSALINRPKLLITQADQQAYQRTNYFHTAPSFSAYDYSLQAPPTHLADYAWLSSTNLSADTLYSFQNGAPYLTYLKQIWEQSVLHQSDLMTSYREVVNKVYEIYRQWRCTGKPSENARLSSVIYATKPQISAHGKYHFDLPAHWVYIALEKALVEGKGPEGEATLTPCYTLITYLHEGTVHRQRIMHNKQTNNLECTMESYPQQELFLYPTIMQSLTQQAPDMSGMFDM